MTRAIATTTETALGLPQAPLGILVDLTTPSGVVHSWSGYGTLEYNGIAYLGVGQLGKVALISETNAVYASGCKLTLEGIDNATISEALGLAIGLPATISLAVMSYPAGVATVVGTAIPVFSGLTDQARIAEAPTGSTVEIDLESKMAQLQRNREYRYTDQMQRFLYPNDGAFRYVNTLTSYMGTWGFRTGEL